MKKIINNKKRVGDYEALNSRRLRVLHIGNIANNGYLNAKFLNNAGLDCDVLCYDYYHIMGCPEWEDALLLEHYGDPFKPNWVSAGAQNFTRPDWFVQGRLDTCISYLIAKNKGRYNTAKRLWRKLGFENNTIELKSNILFAKKYNFYKFKKIYKTLIEVSVASSPGFSLLALLERIIPDNRFASSFQRLFVLWSLLPVLMLLRAIKVFLRTLVFKLEGRDRILSKGTEFDERVSDLIKEFCLYFPERSQSISAQDFEPYRLMFDRLKVLFEYYDIVHAYSTDPILPLLAGTRYVAFEHGTIRNIPFENTAQGRLCALSYRKADWVVITNADNMKAAERLGIQNFSFVPHPVNENIVTQQEDINAIRRKFLTQLNADFLIFHPARQHWSDLREPDWEKGNDILFKGFASFATDVNKRAAIVAVEWGMHVQKSKDLIGLLGISEKVAWVPPMSHQDMVKFVLACDITADQFYLGSFGSTMPKALAYGQPAMLYLNNDMHKGVFSELPQVLNCKIPEDVRTCLERSYFDEDFIQEIKVRGLEWYKRYHSSALIADKLISIYQKVLKSNR